MKKVGVAILNYHLKDQVLECLKSVLASSYPNLVVVVVDNNSNDGLSEALVKYPEVIFIQSGANLGYTGGNNLGIRRAIWEGCEFVFILNPDTTVTKTTISNLVKVAEEEGAGVVGPKIYFKDSRVLWYAGGKFDRANVLGGHRGVDETDSGQYDKVEPTDFVTGAAMLVSTEVFERIGMFDDRYFLYYEDSDFCFRAKQAGFKVIYDPEAVVYHANAQATGLGSPRQDYYITRNRMVFASKFLPLRTQFALWREAVKNIVMGPRRKALFDFTFGRLGDGRI